MDRGDPAFAFVLAEMARQTLVDAVSVLLEEGIEAMPLKGVLLQASVYEDAAERPVSDVDLLVRASDHERSVRALMAAGARPRAIVPNATTLRWPGRIEVDLHREPFPPGMFALGTAGLFERSSVDDSLFGVPIRRLHPLDMYAHLIGHFAKGRLSSRDLPQRRDLILLPEALDLQAGACAAHLARHGLGRAARYGLSLLGPDPFARAVLRALEPDPLGELFARLAREVFERAGPSSSHGVLPTHLLNASLGAASRSLLLQGLDLGRRASARAVARLRFLSRRRSPSPSRR
ncbi:MAG: nucleotidyltransferase family protein [Myxococcales bacterium]|nr:nucleotidyltransferase family protein [Myxococcales bacterium]